MSKRKHTTKCRFCGTYLKWTNRECGLGYKGHSLFCTATCGYLWAVREIAAKKQRTAIAPSERTEP